MLQWLAAAQHAAAAALCGAGKLDTVHSVVAWPLLHANLPKALSGSIYDFLCDVVVPPISLVKTEGLPIMPVVQKL